MAKKNNLNEENQVEQVKSEQNVEAKTSNSVDSADTKVVSSDQMTFDGYVFWMKFLSIMLYITGGLNILGGVVTLIFGVGLINLALGGVMIYIGTRVWKSAQTAREMEVAVDEVEFRAKSIYNLSLLKNAIKTYAIAVIITIVGGIVLAVAFGAFLVSLINSYDQNSNTLPSEYPTDEPSYRRSY